MYRFFIKEEQIHDGMIEICGSDVNHIKNVLRMKTGDKVYLSNGSDSKSGGTWGGRDRSSCHETLCCET